MINVVMQILVDEPIDPTALTRLNCSPAAVLCC